MNNLYIFSLILFFIGFILSILFEDNITEVVEDIKKHVFKKKITTSKKPSIIYFLFIVLILWGIISNISHQHFFWLFMFKHKVLIHKIFIAIFFFILGIIYTEIRTIVNYAFKYYLDLIRSCALTGIIYILLIINFNPILFLELSIAHFLMAISYFKKFNLDSKNMDNKFFLGKFIWLGLMLFIDGFLIIYRIIHL